MEESSSETKTKTKTKTKNKTKTDLDRLIKILAITIGNTSEVMVQNKKREILFLKKGESIEGAIIENIKDGYVEFFMIIK